MDFVIDNYLWFIIGGIVIIMIVIGYFAEKTNFGKKPFGQDRQNEATPSTPEINMVGMENKGINDILGQSKDDTLENQITPEVVDVEDSQTPNTFPDIELPNEDLNVLVNNTEVKSEEDIITPDIPEIIEDEQNFNEDDVWKF